MNGGGEADEEDLLGKGYMKLRERVDRGGGEMYLGEFEKQTGRRETKR